MTPERLRASSRFLQALDQRVLIYDGAMGTSLQKLNLTADDFGGERYVGCIDYLVITRPEAVAGVHRSFLDVGCDVLETNTFRANRITLKEYGLQDRVIEINRTAAQLARRLADEYSTPDKPRFVAGSIGPSGMLPSSTDPVLSHVTFDELVDVFREQAVGLIQGGVDVLLIETSQDILEVKATIFGCHQAMAETGNSLPIQCQVALDTSGRMLLGTDISAVLTTLEALPIDIIGLNCSTGPEHMREPIRYLGEYASLPVACIPNAGLPVNTGIGEAIYPLEPEAMAEALHEFVTRFGVRIIGGCCGTTPAHLKAVVETVNSSPPPFPPFEGGARGGWVPAAGGPGEVESPRAREPRISSAMRAITMRQDPAPLLIGERINSQGSRKVKRLLLEENYEEILAIAREQVESGAHALDVCVALTERQDEAEQMRKLVHLLSATVETPLVIDSTERDVIEAALKAAPGRVIINSINMERGRERIDAIVPLAKAHGAALIALTIDEQGMAKTAERKLEVARRIYDIVVGEYGLAPADLIFDALTFTLATGDAEFRRSAIETIEGIRRIKHELPGVFTSLGVSNVSFGLAQRARAILNSVFLYHCVQAGLDMAIVNPAHITPYAEIDAGQRELVEDLIFARREDALARYIAHFETLGMDGTEEPEGKTDLTAGMTAEERIHWQIVHRKKEHMEVLIDEALSRHDPVWVLNNVLLPAMKEVGDKFGAGELILPFVLQSAEVMKKAVAYLEQFLERKEGVTRGKVVLATVFGDVHDIGKNLVNTILSNNGFTVYDLGKQVPINVIIEKAVEVEADAIGLSALLVSTSRQMPACVKELHRRGLNVPVLIGGAAINRRFGRRALFVDDHGTMYGPGVFYCNDAFEGLEVVDKLTDPTQREAFIEHIKREAREDEFLYAGRAARLDQIDKTRSDSRGPAVRTDAESRTAGPTIVRSNVSRDVAIPKPPFWGWAGRGHPQTALLGLGRNPEYPPRSRFRLP